MGYRSCRGAYGEPVWGSRQLHGSDGVHVFRRTQAFPVTQMTRIHLRYADSGPND